MTFGVSTLKRVLSDATFHRIDDDQAFDVLDIARIDVFENAQPSSGVLYFIVYDDEPHQDGWYEEAFSRSIDRRDRWLDRDVVFVVDSRVPHAALRDRSHIRVPHIRHAIDKLRTYVVDTVRPRVVGVTGSVGKTTAVALLQHTLSSLGCGRVYAKRLTPLSLSSWLVNCLEPGHAMLAVEYALYRKQHVRTLAQLLRPHIGVFLNVRGEHLGVSGLTGIEDIVEGKSALIQAAEVGVLNIDDPAIAALRRPGHLTISQLDPSADVFGVYSGDECCLSINITGQTVRARPYLRTELFLYQACAAAIVAACAGIHPDIIQDALQSFVPKENRITWLSIGGWPVLLDGDVSSCARLDEISRHRYASSVLLIASFDVLGQYGDFDPAKLRDAFRRFDEVRVCDTAESRALLARLGDSVNAIVIPQEHLFENVSQFEYRVLHWGAYHRFHRSLDTLRRLMPDVAYCGPLHGQ